MCRSHLDDCFNSLQTKVLGLSWGIHHAISSSKGMTNKH